MLACCLPDYCAATHYPVTCALHTRAAQTSFHRANLVFRVVPKVERSEGDEEAPCMTNLIKCAGGAPGCCLLALVAEGRLHGAAHERDSVWAFSSCAHPCHANLTPAAPTQRPRAARFVRMQGPGTSGIIYCLSRAEAEGVAQYLKEEGRVAAAHYHAGMSHKARTEVQNNWQAGRTSVIVATIAFGAACACGRVRGALAAVRAYRAVAGGCRGVVCCAWRRISGGRGR